MVHRIRVGCGCHPGNGGIIHQEAVYVNVECTRVRVSVWICIYYADMKGDQNWINGQRDATTDEMVKGYCSILPKQGRCTGLAIRRTKTSFA